MTPTKNHIFRGWWWWWNNPTPFLYRLQIRSYLLCQKKFREKKLSYPDVFSWPAGRNFDRNDALRLGLTLVLLLFEELILYHEINDIILLLLLLLCTFWQLNWRRGISVLYHAFDSTEELWESLWWRDSLANNQKDDLIFWAPKGGWVYVVCVGGAQRNSTS